MLEKVNEELKMAVKPLEGKQPLFILRCTSHADFLINLYVLNAQKAEIVRTWGHEHPIEIHFRRTQAITLR